MYMHVISIFPLGYGLSPLGLCCRGRIKFYTHPPEEWSLPSHVSADIVKEWGKAFDLQSLIEEEKKQLSGKPVITCLHIVVDMLVHMCLNCITLAEGLSSEIGPAMEVESSRPLEDAFKGEELKQEDEEEELEEEMIEVVWSILVLFHCLSQFHFAWLAGIGS